MPTARANGIELEYDTFGERSQPALLLISGMGAQLIFWQRRFCEQLAARGFHVIRFDNRDVGLSTRFDHLAAPPVPAIRSGEVDPPYTLDDMTADTVGLLDALGIGAAHVAGISMGGYIGQLLAIDHSDRVLSLASIMSGPGGADMVFGPPPAQAVGPPANREEAIERRVADLREMSSGRFFDPDRARVEVERAIDRATSPLGPARHAAAIHAARTRIPGLRRVQVPVLVIHGELDPVLPLENARRTAAAARNARLVVIPGLGHELPPQVWPRVIDALADHVLGRAPAGLQDRPLD